MQMKLFCAAVIFSMVSLSAVTSIEENKSSSVQNNFSHSFKKVNPAIKKNHVRLFPNPTVNGTITVNSTSNQPLHFYVFDLEGTLLHRLVLIGKEQRRITNLKKGIYLYDVFKNDESIEQGKIIAK